MGMHADDALDECFVNEDLIFRFLHGGMDVYEAMDHGVADEYGCLMTPRASDRRGRTITTKTCRCCGTTGLTWSKHEGKWRLFENGRLHQCSVNPLR